MKIKAEGIDAELGNNGITLHIARPSDSKHIGTLGFGKAKLKWKRAHSKKPPKQVPIERFIDWLEQQ